MDRSSIIHGAKRDTHGVPVNYKQKNKVQARAAGRTNHKHDWTKTWPQLQRLMCEYKYRDLERRNFDLILPTKRD